MLTHVVGYVPCTREDRRAIDMDESIGIHDSHWKSTISYLPVFSRQSRGLRLGGCG